MTQDNIVKLSPPGTFSDPLTEVLRHGARALLARAVEAEVAGFVGGHADKLTDDGHRRLVRQTSVQGAPFTADLLRPSWWQAACA